jgi:hypothetical protein
MVIEDSWQLGVERGHFTPTPPFESWKSGECREVDEDAFAADIEQLISRLGRYPRGVSG